ncbi:hypothetical protein TNIN_1721 [Trichonephila inaurata madagascariensis]|uniref:Uncharacterized protein n=1 Tax=Trichonephila inaurata madagascariensis TaxID=2747483 RepID=A0A8X6YLH0_9ARAC|nr:hypothetical protein TNIN_1721 [Trichonephila inaurata madagascariensis]
MDEFLTSSWTCRPRTLSCRPSTCTLPTRSVLLQSNLLRKWGNALQLCKEDNSLLSMRAESLWNLIGQSHVKELTGADSTVRCIIKR